MKILLATNVRPVQGGVGTYLNSLASGFEQAGHDVTVLSVFGLAKRFRTVSPGVMGRLLPLLHNDLSAAFIYRATQTIMYLRSLAALRNGNYDVIHCHDVSALNAIALAAGNKPLFLTIHGFLSKEALDRKSVKSGSMLMRLFEREEIAAFNRARAVFSITPAFDAHIRQIAPKAQVIPTTGLIDWQRWRADASPVRTEGHSGGFRIATVSRLVKVKGVEYAIRAMPLLPENVCLDVVGDGPDRQELDQLAQSLGVRDRVTFHGFVPYAEVVNRYRGADVIVVPSIKFMGRQDNSPLSVLEAIAAGRPVIGSEAIGSGEMKHLISMGGVVVPEKDPEQIASAVKLLMNPGVYKQKVESGFSLVESTFSTKIVVEKTLHSYREVATRMA